MKSTGMIRKIDDLGRIVIPKEIRKTLKIREGDSLEIYIEGDRILLNRYAPLGDFIEDIVALSESVSNNTDSNICITDTKQVVIATGYLEKEYLYKDISKELLEKMDERILWQNKGGNKIKIIENENLSKDVNQVIMPIIYEGSVLGAVILLTNDVNKKITETELKLVKVIADYLASRM
ncbi:MAG: AbrB/MazE/SpoVT family DNA-binding domain-containing protein [Clostridia bacterium]|nr:AbrB/MazE/SpoVT family DNA-binding domain-containing protein [Clostridia bacterium]